MLVGRHSLWIMLHDNPLRHVSVVVLLISESAMGTSRLATMMSLMAMVRSVDVMRMMTMMAMVAMISLMVSLVMRSVV